MPPKKKGGKKQEEDWEGKIGEDASGTNGEPVEPKQEAENGEEDEMGGGLLAALKKNRNKKAKKGKLLDSDFVEGEDPVQEANGALDIASKQPEEATFDDGDDDEAFGPPKKGKSAAKPTKDEEEDEGGKVKSKKEKEKEKKEREKQRKKEQVCTTSDNVFLLPRILIECTLGGQKKGIWSSTSDEARDFQT